MTKEILIEKCLELLQNKKNILEKNIELAQEASRDDTKSSAGDKYETTRAMMQIEIDSNKKRLLETQALENILASIDIYTTHTKIGLGSIVKTNQGIFFISIGLGQLKIEHATFFIISPDSPIGKELLYKLIGDSFSFNQKNYIVEEVF